MKSVPGTATVQENNSLPAVTHSSACQQSRLVFVEKSTLSGVPAGQSVSKLDLQAQLEYSGFCAMKPSGKCGQTQQMDSILPVVFRRYSNLAKHSSPSKSLSLGALWEQGSGGQVLKESFSAPWRHFRDSVSSDKLQCLTSFISHQTLQDSLQACLGDLFSH